jgi:hypothetical protein
MPGKYPKEYIQDSKHGDSLKSRRYLNVCRNSFKVFDTSIEFQPKRNLTTNFNENTRRGNFTKICSEESSCHMPPNERTKGLGTDTTRSIVIFLAAVQTRLKGDSRVILNDVDRIHCTMSGCCKHGSQFLNSTEQVISILDE